MRARCVLAVSVALALQLLAVSADAKEVNQAENFAAYQKLVGFRDKGILDAEKFAKAVERLGGEEACTDPDEQLEYATDPPCYFPTTWKSAPLLSIETESPDTKIFTFGLPEGRSLDLPVASAILMRADGAEPDGSDAVRPYNPISVENTPGSFSLLIKRYEEGTASKWAHGLAVGAKVHFKQVGGNVKLQYGAAPYGFGKKSITMLAGGTCIAPYYQALHSLVTTPGEATEVVLLYGSKSASDVLLKDELDALVGASRGRLKVVHVIGATADHTERAIGASQSSGVRHWLGEGTEFGWVDEARVAAHAFPASGGADTSVWVCGQPAFYDDLSGPRGEKGAVGGALQALGFSASEVYKW